MNTTEIPLKDPAVSAAAGDTEQLERAYIDASTRLPVLMFYTSAIAWLIVGTVLAMVVSYRGSGGLGTGVSKLAPGAFAIFARSSSGNSMVLILTPK